MAGKKIASHTVIKEVTGKAGGKVVKFGKMDLTSGQAEILMDMAEDKEEVKVTIERVQEKIPGT
ncbi:MAG: hypothetical protein GWN94_25800 [Phycisphaerae bacterium]|nr:hypothetical protein [Phycisphaerae bacterium]